VGANLGLHHGGWQPLAGCTTCTPAAPILFGVGTIGVLYTMASWWGDVIREASSRATNTRVVQISHRYGMNPVHRLRGDVLRRLVLGLLQFRAVPCGRHSRHPRCGVRRGAGTAMGACSVRAPGRRRAIETFDPWHLPLLNRCCC